MPAKPVDREQIFNRAAELSVPAERAAFLDDACGGDSHLRGEIEQLLRHDNDAGSFLEQPLSAYVATIAGSPFDTVDEAAGGISLEFLRPSDKPGCLGTLDQYGVVEVVGRGGMGLVLRAHDSKLNRVVAIKVMAPELAANAMAVKRFLREAQAAAAVSHDHVVTIHAIHDVHRPPFIVMEFVNGQSLQEKIDRRGALELVEILRIGMQTAAGLAAAHKQGLVHRDIKPANILLENGVERVKLTDFGLARAVDDVSVTQTGQIAGTPQYMSPEQALGHAVDARSDLFSLGSVLYTMCTGRPPFRAETAVAMLRRVCDDDPRPIREVNSEIPDWLEAIIFRLLAKDPGERFQSAAEVSDLLARHLAHVQHPTTAPLPQLIAPPVRRPDSQTKPSVAEKQFEPPFCAELAREELAARRSFFRPVLAAIAGAAALLFLAAFAAVVIYVQTNHGTLRIEVNDPDTTVTIDEKMGVNLQNAENARLTVRVGEHTLHVQQGDLEFDTESFRVRRGEEVLVKIDRVDGSLTAHLLRPEHHYRDGSKITTHSKRLLARAAARSTVGGMSPAAELTEVRRFEGHQERVYFVGHSADGRYVYSAGRDQSVRLWDAATGTQIKQFNAEAPLRSADMSRDGRILAVGGHTQTVTVWNVETGDVVREFTNNNGPVFAVALSNDAQQLAAATQSRSVKLWDMANGEVIWEQTDIEPSSWAVSFSPDRTHVMVCARHGVAILDRASGEVVSKLHSGSSGFQYGFRSAAYSPDGQWVALGCFGDGTGRGPAKVGLWDGNADHPMRLLGEPGDDAVTGLSFSRDGRYLLTGGLDRMLRLWEIESGKQLTSVRVGTQCTQFVSLLPGGQFAVAGGGERWDVVRQNWVGDGDYALRLWQLPKSVGPQPSGTRLFTINDRGELVQIDVSGKSFHATVLKELGDELKTVEGLTMVGDLLYAAVNRADEDSRLYTVNVETGDVSLRGSIGVRQVDGLTWADGELLGVTSKFGGTTLDGADAGWLIAIDPATGKTRRIGKELKLNDLDSLLLDNRGRLLTTDGIGTVDQFYELDRQGILAPKSVAPTPAITSDRDLEGLAQGGDGMLYAVTHPGTTDEKISYLVQIDSETFRHENLGSLGFGTFCMAADGRQSSERDRRNGQGDSLPIVVSREKLLLRGHRALALCAVYSPDGRSILSGGGDDPLEPEMILWDANTGEQVRRFAGHEQTVRCVAISADGRFALSGSHDKTMRMWNIETGEQVRSFGGHDETVNCVAFSSDGKQAACGSGYRRGVSGDAVIRLWNVETGEELGVLKGHQFAVMSVQFSADGRRLLSSGADGTVRLWNAGSGQEIRRFFGPVSDIHDAAFSPDERFVFASTLADMEIVRQESIDDPDNCLIWMWEAETGQVVRTFRGHRGSVNSVAVSPDGRFLASASGGRHPGNGRALIPSRDNTVRIWDMDSGRELARFVGHASHIESVAFSPDGRSIVSCGYDRTVRVWRLPEAMIPASAVATRQPNADRPNPATGQSEQDAANVEMPIARLLGKPVFRHDCQSHSDGIGSAEVGLQLLVLEVLGAEFCKDKRLELGQAEVDAFVARCQTAARKAVQAERQRIEKDLAAADLTEEKKQDLLRRKDQLPADGVPPPPPFDADKEQQTLDTIRLQLADDRLPWLERLALERQEREQALLVEHRSRFVAQAHSQLLPLRRSHAIYQQYGGKVVATQLGFILIGAYFKLVEQAEQSGQLEFLDDELKQAFRQRMNRDFQRPELSPEQFDFQWPVWLSDQALSNLQ